MTNAVTATVAVRRDTAPPVLLSNRARAELLRFAHEGAHLAGELARLAGDEAQAYRDAQEQLLVIRHGLIENREARYYTATPDRRYALRCVIAWTARQAPAPLRLELRNFANRMEVYT